MAANTEMTLPDIERLEALANAKIACQRYSPSADEIALAREFNNLTGERILALCALARRGLAAPIIGWVTPEAAEVIAKGTEMAPHALRSVDVTVHFAKDDARLVPLYAASPSAGVVIPMELHCPFCHEQHIDEGEWETRPHKTHLCAHCEHQWRPANVPTVGVRSIVEAALAAAPADPIPTPLPTDCDDIRDGTVTALALDEDGKVAVFLRRVEK